MRVDMYHVDVDSKTGQGQAADADLHPVPEVTQVAQALVTQAECNVEQEVEENSCQQTLQRRENSECSLSHSVCSW